MAGSCSKRFKVVEPNSGCNVVSVSGQHVMVNNSPFPCKAGTGKQVTVTPLSVTPLSHQIARLGAEHPIRQLLHDVSNPPQSPSVQCQQQQPDVQAVISKLLLKAASKDKNYSEPKCIPD